VPSDWPPSSLLSFVAAATARCCCYQRRVSILEPSHAQSQHSVCSVLLWLLWDRRVTGRANWRPRGCAGCWVLVAGVGGAVYSLQPTAYLLPPTVGFRQCTHGRRLTARERRRGLGKAHATMLPCCHSPPSHPTHHLPLSCLQSAASPLACSPHETRPLGREVGQQPWR
jgi:hypothetical protein